MKQNCLTAVCLFKLQEQYPQSTKSCTPKNYVRAFSISRSYCCRYKGVSVLMHLWQTFPIADFFVVLDDDTCTTSSPRPQYTAAVSLEMHELCGNRDTLLCNKLSDFSRPDLLCEHSVWRRSLGGSCKTSSQGVVPRRLIACLINPATHVTSTLHCSRRYWYLPEFRRLTYSWSPDDVIFTGASFSVGSFRNPVTGAILPAAMPPVAMLLLLPLRTIVNH